MSKHTKGPWHQGMGNGYGCIFKDGEGRMRLETGGTTLYPIASVVTGWDEEEDEANSRLIAAAPTLLGALENSLAFIGDYRERVIKGEITGNLLTDDYEALTIIRNAIEKAIGEQS